jgi:hypothetical protein
MESSQPTRSHPKAVGDASAAMVLARLVQAGKEILVPFGENQRYDLVIDEGDRFIRVQCKTGRIRKGAIYFPTCSTNYHHPSNHGIRVYQHDYRGDADLFGVYCRATDSVYLVPVKDVGRRAASLRIEPTRNSQFKKIRWAKNYLLSSP